MDEYKVDTSGVNKHVWLVKIPDFLKKAWQEAPNNALLGQVKIERIEGKKQPTVVMSVTGKGSEKVKNYTFHFSTPPPMYIFSKDDETNTVAIEGTVEQSCNAIPEISKGYEEIVRKRLEAKQRKKTIQRIDDHVPRPKPRSAPYPTRREKEAKAERKTERREKSVVQDLLFQAFAKKPNYTLKELVAITKQPVNYLKKEILSEICVYNKRGKNKATYELKPEYKTDVQITEDTTEWE